MAVYIVKPKHRYRSLPARATPPTHDIFGSDGISYRSKSDLGLGIMTNPHALHPGVLNS